MIDLTPLDVRKKRGDFRKILRGYDPEEVDTFLDLVAERMEVLVKENLTLAERVDRLWEQVEAQESRETAVREALVTAQELRADMRKQSSKEAELLRKEARREAERIKRDAGIEVQRVVTEAERILRERLGALEELKRQRQKFLKALRNMLEQELDVVAVEEGRAPMDDVALEIDLSGVGRGGEDEAGGGGTVEKEVDADGDEPPLDDGEDAALQNGINDEAAAAEAAAPADQEGATEEEAPEEDEIAEPAEPAAEEQSNQGEAAAENEDGDLEETEDPNAMTVEPKTKQNDGDEPLWLSSLLNHQSRKDKE